MLWVSEEFIAKSMRVRECRGTDRLPGHTYDPDGHVRTGQQMVRKIVTKNAFTLYFFLLNRAHRSVQVSMTAKNESVKEGSQGK
jgi:hypothetical protein